jgi:hypothetical protein
VQACGELYACTALAPAAAAAPLRELRRAPVGEVGCARALDALAMDAAALPNRQAAFTSRHASGLSCASAQAITTMAASLRELRRALAGEVGFGRALDALAAALARGAVPAAWAALHPPSQKPLNAWWAWLLRRHRQYAAWLEARSQGDPPVHIIKPIDLCEASWCSRGAEQPSKMCKNVYAYACWKCKPRPD